MARHRGTVLVDTNVILEAHRTGTWSALVGGYRVETVEECVVETQTGFQRRAPQRQIDPRKLHESFSAVRAITDRELAELAVRSSGIALDNGEASLWAHALHRADAWVLCGPDGASLRVGIRLGFRNRLVSLEELLDGVGHRSRTSLRSAYSQRWHRKALGEMGMAEKREV